MTARQERDSAGRASEPGILGILRFRYLTLLATVLAVSSYACVTTGMPEGWECSGESEGCGEGEVCRSFAGALPRCYTVCDNPWDCPAGVGCSEEDPMHVCLPYSAPCEEHANCWAGFFCSEASGQCVKCGNNGRATDCRGPTAPDDINAAAGDATVTITWTEVPGAEGYDLYWSTNTDVNLGSQRIAGVTSPYIHTGRTNGTTYYYAVVAYDSHGMSPLSGVVAATVDLAAPVWLIAGPGDTQVTIDWAPVDGASGYNLYWGTAADVFTSGTTAEGVTAPYVHSGLANGTAYFFGVAAYNAGGIGRPSTVAQAIPSATPLAGIGQWCDDETVHCDTDLRCENEVCCHGGGPTCCNAASEAVACGGSLACDVHDTSPAFACFQSCEPYTSDACLDGQYCLTDGASCTDKLIDGTSCTNEGQCTSENCVDDVCCNDVCGATCMACSTDKSGGDNGTCTPIPVFADPDEECPLTAIGCSGTGGCKVANKRDATDPQEDDFFGDSVAISGDVAIVGARGEDGPNDQRSFAGAAYVFRRIGSSWDNGTEFATNPEAGDQFGTSVAISGDYAIVGAPGEGTYDAGAAHVFRRTGADTWDSGTRLVATDPQASDSFGGSVAISGDYVIVGANGEGTDRQGAAYVFRRTDTNAWDSGTKLVATDRQARANFGEAVAISGDYAIVGTPGEGTDRQGAAYVFRRTDTNTWNSVTRFVETKPRTGGRFGIFVAISGDYALVAGGWAPYVYRRTGTDASENTWDSGTQLDATSRTPVAISGNYAMVGAYLEDGEDEYGEPIDVAGAAYVFRRIGTNSWNNGRKVVAPDAQAHDHFGRSVAISGNHAIVGAPDEDGDDDLHSYAGAAYIF